MVAGNRVLNEFFFYCLKRLHKLQNFASMKLSSNDPAAVLDHFAQQYAPIAATGSLPEIQAKYFYSKELVAYLTAMLSTVPYSKTGDARINGLLDEQYNAALNRLRGINDKAFNDYLVRRMAAYIARWPVAEGRAAAAAAAPADADAAENGGGGDGGGSDGEVELQASDDEAAPAASQAAGGTGQE